MRTLVILRKHIAGLSDAALAKFVVRASRSVKLRGAVNVLITSSRELRALNRRFRGKDQPTDVLSFPPEPAFIDTLAGDIAISADIARRNARELGHSEAQEIKILVLHGVLHLAGYDHECDHGAMAGKEAKLRKALGLPVGLIERNGRPRKRSLNSGRFPRARPGTDTMNYAIAVALLVMLCLLTLVSYVDRVYTEIGRFLSREFQDNIAAFEQKIEPRLGVGRGRAALSMAVLTQIITAAIAMLVGFAVFRDRAWSVYEILQATLSLILIIILFNRFLPFLFFSRTNGEWLARWVLLLKVLIYIALPVTLVLGFLKSVTALTKEHSDEAPETQAEAVDALIEAGQEEGILHESNRDLIQSVVEFGEKTVREAMKPRPEIVAVPTNTTVEQFIEL